MTMTAPGRDQALLAQVIAECSRVAAKERAFFGRTALQKIMYFLKALGVPMSYRFTIHHYGPFCQEILRDVEWLLADEVIRDTSERHPKYSNYSPDTHFDSFIAGFRPGFEEFHETITDVAESMASLRPEYLELLATLHHLYRSLKATRDRGPWKENVLRQIQKLKGDKFSNDEITRTYDLMVEAGLVEA
jgi:uncharacterized protein